MYTDAQNVWDHLEIFLWKHMELVWIGNKANEQVLLTSSELEIMILMEMMNMFFKLFLHKINHLLQCLQAGRP